MTAHERRRAGLQHPRDVARRLVAFERRDDREDVHRIADRAHHHDADAAPAHRPASRTNTTSRIAFGAAQVSNNEWIADTGCLPIVSPEST